MPPAAEQPIDDQLAALLDRLEPHTAALRALPDCRLFVLLDLYINWMFSERTDHVSAETLGRIASLGATLSLDTTYETETHDG